MCFSVCVCALLFPLHKMTTPLKLPVNDEDCVELRKIGDHVPNGRSLLFIPCPIWLKTASRNGYC